jgi:predicted helicase
MATANIPDKHFFSNRGAKDAVPLYLDKEADKANITTGLLELLGDVTPEDLAGYVYCLLAHPDYTRKFTDELVNREVRVPITKNTKLFSEAAEFGKELIWLHTYGERFHNSKDRPKGKIPKGEAKCVKAVSDAEDKYPNEFSYNEATKTIIVGDGAFAPVGKEVWEFEVSGFKPVQSWLGYRMRERKGKKSSPLDDIHPSSWTYEFTREFLELLWVLQKTLDSYPVQKDLFERVLESDLFTADEFPPVPDDAREGPKLPKYKKGETNLLQKD